MLIEGLCAIQAWLEDQLRRPPGRRGVAVPQSTPAVTSSESVVTIAKMGHRRQDHQKELLTDSVNAAHREEIQQALGRRLNQISAICLPADDETSRIVSLDVRENLAGPECLGATSNVPDFRPFWGEILHLEQGHQLCSVENQENKANEGNYMVFFNTSEDLSPNKCIATMLHIAQAMETTENRQFWKGDVFVVRYNDTAPGGGAFLSLTPGADMREVIGRYLQHSWDDQSLERLRKSKQDMLESSESHNRNREMIRARLTPLQTEILEHLPLGLEASLENLAIYEGDYGAITDTWMEPCREDPSMVSIHVLKRLDELEKVGWSGFSAEHL
ncbi:hypothetical protein LTR78_004683 [Recurvomyces mirabilis]|uniref:Uncharacterized protein n=1 Tax=Recurvomyces mirabilis TaxID=574656 RepID=A0AAE0WPX1_9PEZI|nr:hypothetical protein LTR78_004683 [Recurvomyces mirabilis]KAK5152824.1 hypothetical protein LTS14_007931 [Recurvomyces mirabilis]